MIRLDKTLEVVLDGLRAESATLSDSECFAGQDDKRAGWFLAALDRQVQTVADLPGVSISQVGELRLVISEDTFYELVEEDGVKKWSPVVAVSGILFEYERLHGHFSRQESEALYQKELDGGRAAKLGLAKLQSDILAGIERDFRSRHRSAVRSRLHAAAMSKVAGTDDGTVAGTIA